MQQSPALNPIGITIYKIKDDATQHPYRNRFLNKDEDFEVLVADLSAQVHFFSKEALRRREEQSVLRTLGYIWFDYQDAILAGLGPEEEEWLGYRIKVDDLGSTLYDITECNPKCHLDGVWLYMRVDFEESRATTPLPTDEYPEEDRGSSSLTSVYEYEEADEV